MEHLVIWTRRRNAGHCLLRHGEEEGNRLSTIATLRSLPTGWIVRRGLVPRCVCSVRTGLNTHLACLEKDPAIEEARNLHACSNASKWAARHEGVSIRGEREEYLPGRRHVRNRVWRSRHAPIIRHREEQGGLSRLLLHHCGLEGPQDGCCSLLDVLT